MPEAPTRRPPLALTVVMAALLCTPASALGKALDPSKTASRDFWEPQPECVRVELVRIPGSRLFDVATTTPDAPGIPSFLTRDPAGFIDGPNLYTYVRQNPWSSFDPLGLQQEMIETYFGPRTTAEAEKVEEELESMKKSKTKEENRIRSLKAEISKSALSTRTEAGREVMRSKFAELNQAKTKRDGLHMQIAETEINLLTYHSSKDSEGNFSDDTRLEWDSGLVDPGFTYSTTPLIDPIGIGTGAIGGRMIVERLAQRSLNFNVS